MEEEWKTHIVQNKIIEKENNYLEFTTQIKETHRFFDNIHVWFHYSGAFCVGTENATRVLRHHIPNFSYKFRSFETQSVPVQKL